MFDVHQFQSYILKPCLQSLSLYSLDAENLLLGTMSQESKFGTYLHQINGPALGIFQMETLSHDDIYENFLKYKPKLSNLIMEACRFNRKPIAQQMVHDLFYACCMARIFYLRIEELHKVPIPSTLEGQAAYWKKYYNTSMGGGTVDQYIANFNKLGIRMLK